MWSILATLLCCLPAGIVSIVYASQVSSKQAVGDIAGALDSSKKARLWLFISVRGEPGLVLTGRSARQRWEAALGAACLVGMCGYVTVVDPNRPGHYPTCPLYAVSGLYCPGCGSLRAVHDLFTGDLAGALHCNLLMVSFLPLALAIWLRTALLGHPQPALPRHTGVVLAALLAVWVVARNLPSWPFTLMAPISR